MIVVRDDHAAFAGGDGPIGEEAEARQTAEAAHVVAAVGAAQALGGVLHHRDLQTRAQRDELGHARGAAEGFGHQHAARAAGGGLLGLAHIHVQRGGIGVHEHRSRAHVQHRVHVAAVGEGAHQHLVAGADAERLQRDLHGDRSAGHAHGVGAARAFGHGVFEGEQVGAHRESAGTQRGGHGIEVGGLERGLVQGDHGCLSGGSASGWLARLCCSASGRARRPASGWVPPRVRHRRRCGPTPRVPRG